MSQDKLKEIINLILVKKEQKEISELKDETSLRDDLGFDSLDLAELTVRIEDEFGVDIFETGNVDKIQEILTKI